MGIERNAYPDGASFVDAEQPYAGRAIARAASEGRAVVLCSADGSRQLLLPSACRRRLKAQAAPVVAKPGDRASADRRMPKCASSSIPPPSMREHARVTATRRLLLPKQARAYDGVAPPSCCKFAAA